MKTLIFISLIAKSIFFNLPHDCNYSKWEWFYWRLVSSAVKFCCYLTTVLWTVIPSDCVASTHTGLFSFLICCSDITKQIGWNQPQWGVSATKNSVTGLQGQLLKWEWKIVRVLTSHRAATFRRFHLVRHSDGETDQFSPPHFLSLTQREWANQILLFGIVWSAWDLFILTEPTRQWTQPEHPFSAMLCNWKSSSKQQEESTISCYHALTVWDSLLTENQVIP